MDGVLETLFLFLPNLAKYFPEISGKNKRVRIYNDLYGFVQSEFEKKDPSYISGQPRHFRDAFLDQMELNKENPNSSFHPSRNLNQYASKYKFPATSNF